MLAVTLVPAIPPTFVAVREDYRELLDQAAQKTRAAPPPGQARAAPPPAVRTAEQGPAAAPDQVKLHELAQEEGTRGAVAPDTAQLHLKV